MTMWLLGAAWAVNGTVPVQGVITGVDGVPLDGAHPVTLRILGGSNATQEIASTTATVTFTNGAFAAGVGPFNLDLLSTNAELWVETTVGGVASPPVPVGWTTRSAHALHATAADSAAHATAADHAGIADQIGTLLPADLFTTTSILPWSRVDTSAAPARIRDGYVGGTGITVSGNTISLSAGANGSAIAGNLTVGGAVQVGSSATCDSTTRGSIRWTGTAFEGCTANGWEALAAGGGGATASDGPAWAQIEGPAQTFLADTWTPVTFNAAPISNNLRMVGRSLYFTHPGVYRITLSFRNGNATDAWTAVRLVGGEQVRGQSVGGANVTASPELSTYEFLANVEDVNIPYEIRVGRNTHAMAVAAPAAIVGQALPAVQATVQRLGARTSTTASQFDGFAQTFAANAWTPVSFAGGSHAPAGWTLGANGADITFPAPGQYRVTLAFRNGNGGDVWTAARIFGNGSLRGISAGTGNLANSSELQTFEFLANIADTSTTYQLQLGRAGDALSPVGGPTMIGGDQAPGIQATFAQIPSAKAWAQVEAAAMTFAANSWTAVNFGASHGANAVTWSGANVTFPRAGTYRVTLSFRSGAGTDVWTGVRLFGDGSSRGVSAGTGNFANSPELMTYSFLANIANPSATYQVQVGRLSTALAVSATGTIASTALPPILATFEEL